MRHALCSPGPKTFPRGRRCRLSNGSSRPEASAARTPRARHPAPEHIPWLPSSRLPIMTSQNAMDGFGSAHVVTSRTHCAPEAQARLLAS